MAERAVLNAFRAMINLEIMAVRIYRGQRWRLGRSELTAESLAKAIAIEERHVRDLVARRQELGDGSSLLSPFYALAGWVIGFVPSLLGQRAALKTGIWVEERAVKDYQSLLDRVPFDDDSRALVKRNQEDEREHIRMWEEALAKLGQRKA
ncbi:MAG: demethoxyubiquinone hydroxylase family protein [Dehalococcoidia bacterium]